MSSGEIHGLHGASVGAIMYTNYHYTTMRPVDLVEGSAFVAVGLLSGRLPDLLEPATSPRHRAFFHSVLFMILLGALTYRFLID